MPDDLRRRVLDASAAIVSESGVAALSMREVARRAGVSHQAPYHHFPDREAILAALVEEGFAALADTIEAAERAEVDPRARLVATGTAYVRAAMARPGHFRLLFRPDLVSLDRFPDARAQAERARAPLVRVADALVAEGRLPPEDHDTLVATAWSLVHGLAVLVLDGPLAERPCLPGSPRGEGEPGDLAGRVPAFFAGLLPEPARRSD